MGWQCGGAEATRADEANERNHTWSWKTRCKMSLLVLLYFHPGKHLNVGSPSISFLPDLSALLGCILALSEYDPRGICSHYFLPITICLPWIAISVQLGFRHISECNTCSSCFRESCKQDLSLSPSWCSFSKRKQGDGDILVQ